MKKVGRNDKCFCGSGQKYKFCCYKNSNFKFNDIECDEKMRNIVKSVYDFIEDNNFGGGCHLLSAITYILLKEEGYDNLVVKTGVVEISDSNVSFDHSWLEYEGKKIDMALLNTLDDSIKFAPIFLDKCIGGDNPFLVRYGVDVKLDATANHILQQSLGDYILKGESQNSLIIFEDIAGRAGSNIQNIKETVSKYKDTYRVLENKL